MLRRRGGDERKGNELRGERRGPDTFVVPPPLVPVPSPAGLSVQYSSGLDALTYVNRDRVVFLFFPLGYVTRACAVPVPVAVLGPRPGPGR